MKRSIPQEFSNKTSKMARMQIGFDKDASMIVASGTGISNDLGRHFGYELSDKKAKSNLLKGAGRDMLEIAEKQKCVMFTFSVGAFLETVIPMVEVWSQTKVKIKTDEGDIDLVDFVPGFDENGKHMDTLLRFRMNQEKITVCVYNTTQRIKVEGKGYLIFVGKYFQQIE